VLVDSALWKGKTGERETGPMQSMLEAARLQRVMAYAMGAMGIELEAVVREGAAVAVVE